MMQGKVYDVTGNTLYQLGSSYHGTSEYQHGLLLSFGPSLTMAIVFAGKDASRALGKSSTDPEDVKPEWRDLGDKENETLNEWITFFSKRYNVVGVVEGATNVEQLHAIAEALSTFSLISIDEKDDGLLTAWAGMNGSENTFAY